MRWQEVPDATAYRLTPTLHVGEIRRHTDREKLASLRRVTRSSGRVEAYGVLRRHGRKADKEKRRHQSGISTKRTTSTLEEDLDIGGEAVPVDRPGFKPGGRRHASPGGFDSHSPPPASPRPTSLGPGDDRGEDRGGPGVRARELRLPGLGMASARTALHVLVADDYPDAAELLATFIQGTSLMRVTTNVAFDGAQAVERAKAHRPNAVVLDIDMPKMNGIDAAKAIRAALPLDTPLLIAMTGNLYHSAAMSTRLVFDHVLAKPIDFDLLLDLLGSG